MKEELKTILDETRSLTEIETFNLNSKARSGALPVDYMRRNLFNASARTIVALKRKKTIYEDENLKIQVNRSLNQRHRDLLSLLFLENKGISRPNPDGSYLIYTNLYALSKKMGYSNIKGGASNVQKLLNDLRGTDIIVKTDGLEYGHSILGDYFLDLSTNQYAIRIPSMTAKFHILNYAVSIPKEINAMIVAIPPGLSRIKALINFTLSSKSLSNGISFSKICEKFEIVVDSRKSQFKKELIENTELLKSFHITYNEEKEIIYYKGNESISFLPYLAPKTIIGQLTLDFIEPDLCSEERKYKTLIAKQRNKKESVIEGGKLLFIDFGGRSAKETILLKYIIKWNDSKMEQKEVVSDTEISCYSELYKKMFED